MGLELNENGVAVWSRDNGEVVGAAAKTVIAFAIGSGLPPRTPECEGARRRGAPPPASPSFQREPAGDAGHHHVRGFEQRDPGSGIAGFGAGAPPIVSPDW